MAEGIAALEGQLLLIAATLAGLCTPANAAASFDPASAVRMAVDCRDAEGGGSLCAGELLLAPAFMSAAAEAQVEAALEAIRQNAKASSL